MKTFNIITIIMNITIIILVNDPFVESINALSLLLACINLAHSRNE